MEKVTLEMLIEKVNDACGYLLVPALHNKDVNAALNMLLDVVSDSKDLLQKGTA